MLYDHPPRAAGLMQLGRDLGCGVVLRDFDTPLEECIARDAQRPRPVGEARIREMHQQLIVARKH